MPCLQSILQRGCSWKAVAFDAQVVAVRAFQGQATEAVTKQHCMHLIKALELGEQSSALQAPSNFAIAYTFT